MELKRYQRDALKALEDFLQAAFLKGANAASLTHAYAQAMQAPDSLAGAARPAPYQAAHFGDTPWVCLRLPTGGGKTLLASHVIERVARTWHPTAAPVVIWLTPSDVIRDQTLGALKTPGHPYLRALQSHYPQDRLRVLALDEIALVSPQDFGAKAIVLVANIQSFRIDKDLRDKRNAYRYSEDFERHFSGLPAHLAAGLDRVDASEVQEHGLGQAYVGRIKHSLMNLFKLHAPIVIVDEAQNVHSDKSFDTLRAFHPRCIVELTATPKPDSNVIYRVSALQLKAAQMIKLPVVLTTHAGGWEDALRDAKLARDKLEFLAQKEPDYVRPILLVQAENKGGTATVEVVKQHLIAELGVAESEIAIATGEIKGIEGVDLFDKKCSVRVIITIEALREGWDCSFAYVLCALQQIGSRSKVEQLLGRVLRMPYARNRTVPELNQAYAHVVSPAFTDPVRELAQRMVEKMGFERMEALVSLMQMQVPDLASVMPTLRDLPPLRIELPRAPVLATLDAGVRSGLRVEPMANGVTLTVNTLLTLEVQDAILSAVTGQIAQSALREQLVNLRQEQDVRAAPSCRGVRFAPIPQLCIEVQGELELLDREALHLLYEWNLLDTEARLPGFKVEEESHSYTIDISEVERLKIGQTGTQIVLNDMHLAVTEGDLVRWLDGQVRQRDVPQPQMQRFLSLVVNDLLHRQGNQLTGLVRAKYQLAKTILDEIEKRREAARGKAFQAVFELGGPTVSVSSEDEFAFTFSPLAYPAQQPIYSGRWHFDNHYYPMISSLKSEGEEFDCAVALDACKAVEKWTRNLVQVPDCSFRLPLANGYFYPDFVAELYDGRIFVVEYKGAQLLDASAEKQRVGELWEAKSGGRCVFAMVVHPSIDPARRSLVAQIAAAVERKQE